MNAKLLQEFRAMQLAVRGASLIKGGDAKFLILEGIDAITLSDYASITEISLVRDCVDITIEDSMAVVPITTLSDSIIEEIIGVMSEKALYIADCVVMVNGNGELAPGQIRK